MDKCWFVLPQTHYPPPTEENKNGTTKQFGSICLGHFIKDLKHLDQVINTSGLEPFPLDMPVYRTQTSAFEWESNKESGLDVSANAEIPIAAVAGITAKASLGFALKKTVGSHWQIDQLETMVMQPSRNYLTRCLASASLAEYIRQNKFGPTWSVYMITGLKIVRGKSSQTTSRGRERGVNGGPGIGAAGVAEANLDTGVSRNTSVSVTAQHENDFVWAVRLSKVTRGLFDKTWTHKTFSKGATFGMDEGKQTLETVQHVLSEEKLEYGEILGIESEGVDEVVVI